MKSGAARDRLAQGIVGAAGGLGAYVIIVLTALPVIRAASSPPPPLPFLHNRDSTDKSQTQQAAGGLKRKIHLFNHRKSRSKQSQPSDPMPVAADVLF